MNAKPERRRGGWWLPVAFWAAVYLTSWGATAQFGVPPIAASVSAEQPLARVNASSPCPFVVHVECNRKPEDGVSFSARYVWVAGATHEISHTTKPRFSCAWF